MSSELLMADSKAGARTTEGLFKAETIVLPRDKTNRFVYFFKQNIASFYFSLFLIIVTVTSGYMGFRTDDDVVTFFGFFFMILGLASFLVFLIVLHGNTSAKCKLNALSDECKIKLLVEVITRKPNVDMETWDPIACSMNQYAYDRGTYPDKSLFYDGNICYRVFRELAIVPYCENPNGNCANTDLGVENNQRTKYANKLGNDKLPFELKTYILKALAVFRESVDKYWADKFPEVTV
ncbi:uncharacterized protein SKDI_06G1280 [Saccharomyces kudriavzevii IFO 1802]|uniref:Uncharacterized protein n=2 Tax=Saccharomyces kudriavzevii (strain ATCC MYA-4449 / AS 2.2408 / CBS 8840 / NBRC 1802 / NCYC 2889) TaxID=226230 RepID=A0AA35JIU5_SACK1|nr:uncharacterized protein SKDI_06G1280 [Saccharomyces kudriavzevii IFO 1802]EJT43535.1 hypothetical protein SKUD_166606 [Saccharomyces kudriavzevii IFO 1802]CAI4061195.1 hypothetical protein SKDI_06G1280 [Saccharomyces kudriavzevii IFO 1802]